MNGLTAVMDRPNATQQLKKKEWDGGRVVVSTLENERESQAKQRLRDKETQSMCASEMIGSHV